MQKVNGEFVLTDDEKLLGYFIEHYETEYDETIVLCNEAGFPLEIITIVEGN